jgi:PAS domain S-box-containing protein
VKDANPSNSATAPRQPQWSPAARIEALNRYNILDTPIEADFDDLAKLAADAFDAPIAVVNLIASDRQWFKAEIGIGTRELPLEMSICYHAILGEDLLVIPDTWLDPRVEGNPLVVADGGLRFYAGALLRTPEGLPIGTICVLDRAPRPDGITPFQQLTLEVLARQVMTQLELRRALSQRREDEKRHRLILDSALDYGIITMDLRGIVTSWNRGACELLGWSEAEICGLPCSTFFTPEDREAGIPDIEMADALTKGHGNDERWHLRKNGSRFWASGEMMVLTDDNDVPIGFLKILRDRTAQRRALQALESSEARTRLALEAGELGAWESTPALGQLIWDARARELLGHTEDEPIDFETSFLARVHPDDREHVVANIQEALGPAGDGTTDLEYRTISAVDGRERWIHAKGALAVTNEGDERFVGTVRDITNEKESQNQRKLLMDELEHRLKNTMSVVQAIVSQSLRNAVTPDEAREAIGQRLITLSHAHTVLTQTSWSAAPMRSIIEGAAQTHGPDPERLRVDGPDLQLSPKAALAFSMALNELSTNAAKYGALSNQAGYVELTWQTSFEDGEQWLDLRWQEYGGPPVVPPERTGFGSRLINGLAKDMGGQGAHDYRPEGAIWTLRSRLDKITA